MVRAPNSYNDLVRGNANNNKAGVNASGRRDHAETDFLEPDFERDPEIYREPDYPSMSPVEESDLSQSLQDLARLQKGNVFHDLLDSDENSPNNAWRLAGSNGHSNPNM